jgi:HK97 gp10 family phage protein
MAGYNLSINMLGVEELKKALENTSVVARQELANALNKAANDAHQDAVSKAPHKSGRLWGSIHSENASPNNLVAKVGTKLEYARAQEFGTVGMTIHSHSRTGKAFTYIGNIKPKFYMKQAFENVKPKLTNYLEEAARRIVEQMAGK